jgi:MFS family permease
MVPQLVISPIAGVFVDRWDRKRLLIASDLLRAAIVLGYFLVQSADQAWLIYVLAFAESSVSRFFRPAVAAVLPRLVPREQIARANAMLGLSNAIAQLGGPALGGVLFTVVGPHGAAAFDAVSYLLSAVAILLMRIPSLEHAPSAARSLGRELTVIGSELAHGVEIVLQRATLRGAFLSAAVIMLSQGIINVLLVVMVKKIWGGGAAELGLLVSAQGIGSLIGAGVVGQASTRIAPRTLVMMGGVSAGISIVLTVNQPSVYVAMLLIALAGIPIVGGSVGLTTCIQTGSDDHNRGRVAALFATVGAAATLTSIIFTSLVGDAVGPVPMLTLAGVIMFLGGLVALAIPGVQARPVSAPAAAVEES